MFAVHQIIASCLKDYTCTHLLPGDVFGVYLSHCKKEQFWVMVSLTDNDELECIIMAGDKAIICETCLICKYTFPSAFGVITFIRKINTYPAPICMDCSLYKKQDKNLITKILQELRGVNTIL